MALKEAVKFRRLLSILDREEKYSFLLKLITNTPQMIESALFHYFNTALEDDALFINTTKHAVNLDLNAQISKIINARSLNSHDDCKVISRASLVSIPQSVISKVASYLQQQEYGNLCKVSRDIFIGCQSPNSLHEISFECETNSNHYPFEPKLYTAANTLEFDLAQYQQRLDEIMLPSFLDQLQEMTLCCNGNPNEEWIYDFVECFPVCKNIQTLRLQWWTGETVAAINEDFFKSFLSKFPNVHYLQLVCVSRKDIDIIKNLYPQLKGLFVSDGLDSSALSSYRLIRHYAENLVFLHFESDIEISYAFNDVKFHKLEQLRLRKVLVHHLNDLIRSTSHLRKVEFRLLSDAHESAYYDIYRQQAIAEMVRLNEYLEYIEVDEVDSSYFVSILRGIVDGLKQTRDRKRSSMKIVITMRQMRGYGSAHDFGPSVLIVKELEHLLKSMNCDDYILVWREVPIAHASSFEPESVKTAYNEDKKCKIVLMKKFRVGDNVKIIDSKSRDHWNGLIGTIVGRYSATKKRWPVQIDDGDKGKRCLLLKESNLIRWNNNNELNDKYACNISGYSEQWMM